MPAQQAPPKASHYLLRVYHVQSVRKGAEDKCLYERFPLSITISLKTVFIPNLQATADPAGGPHQVRLTRCLSS